MPVNIRQPREVVEFIVGDAQICFAFTDEEGSGLLLSSVESCQLDNLVDLLQSPTAAAEIAVTAQSTALILYTSGSTGRPKGVVLSHASQLAMVDAVVGDGNAQMFSGQRGIVVAPMFHMNVLVFIASFMAGGGSLVLMSKFDAVRFYEAIERHRVTIITGVPTMIAMLARDKPPDADLSSVTSVYIGSAPVTEAIVNQSRTMMANATVLNSYGTTETGGGLFGSHPDNLQRPATSVDYPTSQAEVRRDDEGVLWVKAEGAITEYLNLPDVTAQKLQNGWFNTGDRFTVDDDGFYYFSGRADDMFVCSGENVFPGELEKVIEAHDAVVQAVVVPVDDHIRGQMPVAFVVGDGTQTSVADIQDHVRRHAASYLYPRRVWFLDAMPLASTTKIDRRSLQARAVELMATESAASS